jgi:hypothetical protein
VRQNMSKKKVGLTQGHKVRGDAELTVIDASLAPLREATCSTASAQIMLFLNCRCAAR